LTLPPPRVKLARTKDYGEPGPAANLRLGVLDARPTPDRRQGQAETARSKSHRHRSSFGAAIFSGPTLPR
jgi:hypothetical protein